MLQDSEIKAHSNAYFLQQGHAPSDIIPQQGHAPSDIIPQQGHTSQNQPKQCQQVGTNYSNTQDDGEHNFLFKPPQSRWKVPPVEMHSLSPSRSQAGGN